jgi:hypothetical protein
MGVDYWNKYATTAGRPSVRIETTKSYQYGLFVADLAHMPASVCGTWPAFWTVSHVDYPSQGEIDILENIHENTQSIQTLHTSANCSVVGNELGAQQYGKQVSYNCDDKATYSDYGSQSTDQGCSATDSDPNSYGSTFNANSGGVCALNTILLCLMLIYCCRCHGMDQRNYSDLELCPKQCSIQSEDWKPRYLHLG